MSEYPLPDETSEDLDPEIARYENMPIADVRKELRQHGIDPAETVAAVTSLIESTLAGSAQTKSRR